MPHHNQVPNLTEATPRQRRRIYRLSQEEPTNIAQLTCPDCGASLRLQLSRYGRFYGCETWRQTRCRGAVSAHDDGTPYGPPAPTGSPEKERRRRTMKGKVQLEERPERPIPTRYERIRSMLPDNYANMNDEKLDEFVTFGHPEGD